MATRIINRKPKSNPKPQKPLPQPLPLSILGHRSDPQPDPAPEPEHEPADAYPGTVEREAQLDAMAPKAAADAAWADVEKARNYLNAAVAIQRRSISRLEALQQEESRQLGEEYRRRAQEISERTKHMYGR